MFHLISAYALLFPALPFAGLRLTLGFRVYDEAPGKGDVLRGYANYWIDNVKNCDGIKHHQVYDGNHPPPKSSPSSDLPRGIGITTNFIEILQDPHHGSLENFSNFHWFWLLVIPRSMAIEITEEKKIGTPPHGCPAPAGSEPAV